MSSKSGAFFHVYNKGIENKIIFTDAQDYETFLGYLKEYVTPPKSAEDTKQTFTVNGKTYRGTPHQPKNYYNKIEVVAYSLHPDHYHLLVRQIEKDALEKLIRSLCTRYVIYFNKKYSHTGSLFAGPYKSVQITNESDVPALSSYFHVGNNDHSTYPEYTGSRETSWIDTTLGANSSELAPALMIDTHTQTEKHEEIVPEIQPVMQPSVQPVAQEIPATPIVTHRPRKYQYLAASTSLFLLLLVLGLHNIDTHAHTIAQAQSNPMVLSESDTISTQPTQIPLPTPEITTTQSVHIVPGAAHINIHQDASLISKSIGKANGGEVYEFISHEAGWYEIKIDDYTSGFISEEFIIEK